MNSEVIVVGLGAMGSAALYQLARRGIKAAGIDQFSPPHKFGSSHGDTRITRKAIGEGIEFVPLSLRSYELWREIEAESGASLLTITGGLIMASASGNASLHGNSSFINETIKCAREFGISHQALSAGDIKKRFPQFDLLGDEMGYFEEDAGFLRPENCVSAQLGLAEKYGAKIIRDERVLDIHGSPGKREVISDKGRYQCEKVIISSGGWVKGFVKDVQKPLFKVYRQMLYWFDISEAFENYRPENFPVFIWEFGRSDNDFIYGFPAIDGKYGGLKLAGEVYLSEADPDEIGSGQQDGAGEFFRRFIDGRFKGISPGLVKEASCLYTMTPDSKFVIDKIDEDLILASPCSGHGFKHSASIGEILAELAIEGRSKIDIAKFSLARFSP